MIIGKENKKLSIKQKQVLEAIKYFISEHGFSPTNQELAILLKCSPSTVFEKIVLLEKKGYIKTMPGKSRTISIIKQENSNSYSGFRL